MGSILAGNLKHKSSLLVFITLLIWFAAVASASSMQADGREAVQQTGSTGRLEEKPDSSMDGELESLRKELKETPTETSALRLGELLLKKGAPEEALASFNRALEMNPRSLEAKIGRGVALGGMGETEKAEKALREALLLNPNPARVHLELGRLFEQRGDFAGAIAEYKEGLKRFQEGLK
jgi:tetratricopeptide (TPR) repeat protein